MKKLFYCFILTTVLFFAFFNCLPAEEENEEEEDNEETVIDLIYTANEFDDSITVYNRTAEGNISPLRTIAGAATHLNGPAGVALDKVHELIFVANRSGNSITVYSSDAAQSADRNYLKRPHDNSIKRRK